MRRGAITSSFKGNIGHTGHACGGVETVMGIKAMQENMIPKLLNLNEPCVDLNFPFENTKKEINIMMK
jgi:3-oxoacyl-(acyl-carrier-protein) synthase